MAVRILRTGMGLTLQDAGRPGFRSIGVPVSGALDAVAFRQANLLCGNDPASPALESTFHGAMLLFEEGALVACCGGGAVPMLNGSRLPMGRPLWIPAASLLVLAPHPEGCRSYVAVAGGFIGRTDLGSASQYPPASLGGIDGAPLAEGDVLHLASRKGGLSEAILESFRLASGIPVAAKWGIMGVRRPCVGPQRLRFMRGPEWGMLDAVSRGKLTEGAFMLSSRSNRMGFRLKGPTLHLERESELISSAVSPGTLQYTPDGDAILLMQDAQTTGGYPRIAQVVEADLPLAAQLRPGEVFRLGEVSVEEGERLLIRTESALRLLQLSIDSRFGV